MRNTWKLWLATAFMSGSLTSFAQAPAAPAAAPAAKTAPAPAAMPAAKAVPAAPSPAATSKPAPAAPMAADKTAKSVAAGGGAGKVWVNENTKVYHCQGSRFYGTTKNGKYMTETEAKTAGMHGANNKACS